MSDFLVGLLSEESHTSDPKAELPSPRSSSPTPALSESSATPTPSVQIHECSTPCRGILRRRHSPMSRGRSSSPCCKSVSFAEQIDEHLADDWDRKAVKVACPSYREILELKQMMLELLPNRAGLSGPEYSLAYDDSDTSSSQYFNILDDDDVDPSSRCPPNRKRFLKTVPLELCPILPISSSPKTPLNSRSASPISPLHTPSRGTSPSTSRQSSPIRSPGLSPSRPHEAGFNTKPTDMGTLSPKRSIVPSPLTLHQPTPRQKPLMTLLPLLPTSSPTGEITPSTFDNKAVPTPPMTPVVATEPLKDNPEKKDADASTPKIDENRCGIAESTSDQVPLRVQPLPSVQIPLGTSQEPLGSCYTSEPNRRQIPLAPIFDSHRGSFTPSPPPLPLLHSLSSCSPTMQGGIPCSVSFKARANLGTA